MQAFRRCKYLQEVPYSNSSSPIKNWTASDNPSASRQLQTCWVDSLSLFFFPGLRHNGTDVGALQIHSMPGFIITSRDVIVMRNKNRNVARVRATQRHNGPTWFGQYWCKITTPFWAKHAARVCVCGCAADRCTCEAALTSTRVHPSRLALSPASSQSVALSPAPRPPPRHFL